MSLNDCGIDRGSILSANKSSIPSTGIISSVEDKENATNKSNTNCQIQAGKGFAVSMPVARERLADGRQQLVLAELEDSSRDTLLNKREKRSIANKTAFKKKESSNKGQSQSQKKQQQQGTRASEQKKKHKQTNEVEPLCPLVEFAERAAELKADIANALEQRSKHGTELVSSATAQLEEPIELLELRQSLIKLSEEQSAAGDDQNIIESIDSGHPAETSNTSDQVERGTIVSEELQSASPASGASAAPMAAATAAAQQTGQSTDEKAAAPTSTMKNAGQQTVVNELPLEFEPLMSQLDPGSKLAALKSSLGAHFAGAPQMLEPVCAKLIDMSEANQQLARESESWRLENHKLRKVKERLEALCRELQRSNNELRIDSLDVMRLEQVKAKEQAAKIQSTLAGVIKLFDENQKRNMELKQENVELQTKLRALLEHCDAWEKSVEATLKQRDIEIKLLKTELAKASLVGSEQANSWLTEKRDLLKTMANMQEQQLKIETQEARLRADLASYASKYDSCQSAITSGLSKFQLESKRMLKQLEKSKQDYVVLLAKYETSNKRIAQLLEERQRMERANKLANKKIDTLERLCRALKSSDGQQKECAEAASAVAAATAATVAASSATETEPE